MKNRFVAMAALAVCAIGTVAQATPQSFDQVNMRYTGMGSGRSVGLQFWVGSTKVMDSNLFAGSLNHQFSSGGQSGVSAVQSNGAATFLSGRTVATFCTDILEHVDSNWRTHNIRNVEQAPATQAGQGMGEQRSDRLSQLYGYGRTNGLLNEAGGWASDSGSDANKDKAAAWQLLVWEIVFGDANDSNWASTGALRVSGLSNQVRNYFAQFRDLSASYSTDLAGFRASSRAGSQDQLVIIPLPPAVYAGAGMLGLVFGAKALRRRQARLA